MRRSCCSARSGEKLEPLALSRMRITLCPRVQQFGPPELLNSGGSGQALERCASFWLGIQPTTSTMNHCSMQT